MDLEALMKLAILQNEIYQGELAANIEVPVELNDSEKTQFSNEWCTFRELNANLIKHRDQAFSLIRSVHPADPRQNEAGYGSEYSDHII
jgi:hypothetical protein